MLLSMMKNGEFLYMMIRMKLFELLALSGALSELSWPAILSKRHIFREVFMDFEPVAVSKLNEKKLIAPGSMVIDEFGSFDEYIWRFDKGRCHKQRSGCFRFQECITAAEGKEASGIKDGAEEKRNGNNVNVIESKLSIAIDELSFSS